MTRFFDWPSQAAKQRQAAYNYEILYKLRDQRAYTNNLPREASQYWGDEYIIWDLRVKQPINKNDIF